ncbi:hypothetical protein NY78_0778 [Desulfovibrio sp. TomC]|nr:hypothetical protein NY78_0778 [Desulfovibrio sp. TomC]
MTDQKVKYHRPGQGWRDCQSFPFCARWFESLGEKACEQT